MPGHCTYLPTARRVADLLAGGEFPDGPALSPGGAWDARLRRGNGENRPRSPVTGPDNHQETALNPIRAIRRPARILAVLASAVLTALAAPPAALATPRPWPPGWNTHPLPPAHVHPLTTGSIPGWQLTLMAVTVVLLVATLVAIGYPGPGRPAAGAPTHRLSDDRIRRGTDPQQQPATAARSAPAGQDR